jgi:hypothetical protein
MNNMFSINFNNRATFGIAIAILVENAGNFSWSINRADMIINFFNKIELHNFISELAVHQIWDKPSFKGPADFTIE